jgi:hypothetical protein
MVVDANLKLFDAALTIASNTAVDTQGTAVNIGKTGLHRNAQLVVFVPTAAPSHDLIAKLQLTTDNSTWRDVGSVVFAAGFKGKRVVDVGMQIPWQEYDSADIDVRLKLDNTSLSITATWGTVVAYLGAGETELYGRLPTADTLADS